MFEFAVQRIRKCFYNQVQDFIFHFQVPNFKQNNFNGNIKVLFEVDATGTFSYLCRCKMRNFNQRNKRVLQFFQKNRALQPTHNQPILFTITIAEVAHENAGTKTLTTFFVT
jgi:hypothetical protein